MKSRSVFALVVFLSILLSPAAFAMAKKPASGGSCEAPAQPGAAHPVRKVVMRPVGTVAFQLPNGSMVDLHADLAGFLATAVTSTGVFSPTDAPSAGAPADPCDRHLEIRAAVTSLELDAFELGLSFGYTPSGASSTITSLTGKADVKIGTIAMDFGVWDCSQGRCSEVAASTATHVTAGVNVSLTIDFSVVHTGPELAYNTPLGDALRSIMVDGMKRLSGSSTLSRLPWNATVREVNAESGMLIFDAGADAGLGVNQGFVVYAATPSSGACGVYKAVAYLKSVEVDTVSTTASVEQALDARGARVGDAVLVRP